MKLPGRLRAATLGDLLGHMFRERVSGTLELREVSGPTGGRAHRIHLRAGLVVSVTTDASDDAPVAMSRDTVKQRLEAIFCLADAELGFHVVTRRPTSVLPEPLAPVDYLHGRPRKRDTAAESPSVSLRTIERRRALATLGLSSEASDADVHRAFKMLAVRVHPDRHPAAEPHERDALSAHFSRLAQAYHVLVA